MASAFDKLMKARISQNGAMLPNDAEAKKQFPNLWEWLTRTEVDDGRLKDPARLSIQVGLGCWEVTIMDASLKMGCTASAKTLAGACEAMERELTSPEPRISVWKGKALDLRAKPKGETK